MSETTYEATRSHYFTFAGEVERLIEKGPLDARALAKLENTADDLSRAAARLRHNLPSRAVDTPTFRNAASYRYFIVFPDGEITGHCYYVQRPAAVKTTRELRRNRPELRLWDEREKTWVEID